MNIDINKLSSFSLFKGIADNDFAPLLKCLGAHCAFYKKGEYVHITGSEFNCIGLVCTGCIHMVKEDIWGKKSILSIIEADGMFGETYICSRNFAANVSFYAADNSEIIFLPFSRVINSCTMACEFHHRLIENMVELIAQKNIAFIEKLEITSKKTIREKILTYLSQQIQKCGRQYFTAPMGRAEMADYLSVDRSALSRELSNMKAEGLIDYDKSTFRLL